MDNGRRKAITTLGGGLAVVGLLGTLSLREAVAATGQRPPLKYDAKGQVVHQTLPYVPLDPDKVAERAYRNYYEGDCMYGVFASIVEALAEKVGGDYNTYPTTVTRYGAGGVLGRGTLCGAANGAAMAIYLVSNKPAPLIDEVFNYYQVTPLPDYRPQKAKDQIVPSVAGSTLCHVSVSEWCKVSGQKSFSPMRAERCAHLVASVTRKTVAVLNAQAAGTFKAAFPISAEVKACRGCHDQGGQLENTRGKMACLACHPAEAKDHP